LANVQAFDMSEVRRKGRFSPKLADRDRQETTEQLFMLAGAADP
jgi:hypothetical protein